MKLSKLERAVEAILFAAGDAVPLAKLAYAIGQDIKITKKVICELQDYYDIEKRGIQILEINNSYQMCTRVDYYDYIKKLLRTPQKYILTDTQLETLAIVAYKQPVTKAQIEDIRGVHCNHVINKLIEYNLICEKGRLSVPGRPLLFSTTDEFLKHFGLKNTKELPEINKQVMEQFENEAATEFE